MEQNQTKLNINREPLDRLIKIPYDARADLSRIENSLEWSLSAKGPQTFFKTNSYRGEAARFDSWYESRTAEIARAEQAFRQRLEAARKSGTLDQSDYIRAVMDLESPSSPFRRARQ